MRLIDSNLIIYFAKPGFAWLNSDIQTLDAHFSILTKVEVLGYHLLHEREKTFFETYFNSIISLSPTDLIIERAIHLKQSRKMSLGDSVIAATALVHDLDLYTHNVSDFAGIEGLRVVDPISQNP
jgi:predicted nucleic acid-binding protein